MALQIGTGLRQFLQEVGGYKQALEGGIMEIRMGSPPTFPDDAATGSLICKVTKASGTHTPEVLATGLIALTGGGSGNVSSITIDGYQVLGATVNFNTDLTTTAADIVKQINRYVGIPNWVTASSSGATITLTVVPQTGITLNGKTIAVTSATITTQINGGSSITMGGAGATAGVASVNGLEFDYSTLGKIKLNAAASGVNLTSAVAGYFRILGSVNDSGALSTSFIRIQGTIGTSGADYNVINNSFESGATHTVATLELSVKALA